MPLKGEYLLDVSRFSLMCRILNPFRGAGGQKDLCVLLWSKNINHKGHKGRHKVAQRRKQKISKRTLLII